MYWYIMVHGGNNYDIISWFINDVIVMLCVLCVANICVRSGGDTSCGRLRISMLRLGEWNRQMASLGAGAPEDSIGIMAARTDSR